MQKEFWYITDKQIKLAKEENACSSALEWAKKQEIGERSQQIG